MVLTLPTHRYATSGAEGGHSLQVLLCAFERHSQHGGVRVAQLIVLIDEGDAPFVVR